MTASQSAPAALSLSYACTWTAGRESCQLGETDSQVNIKVSRSSPLSIFLVSSSKQIGEVIGEEKHLS